MKQAGIIVGMSIIVAAGLMSDSSIFGFVIPGLAGTILVVAILDD